VTNADYVAMLQMNIFSRSGRLSGGAFRPGASRTEIDVWKEFHRIARGRLSIGYEVLFLMRM
jgi:hypothetical protein